MSGTKKLKLGLYENFIGGVIDKSEYLSSATATPKSLRTSRTRFCGSEEMKQTVTTGTTERNSVTLFKQYENVEELKPPCADVPC